MFQTVFSNNEWDEFFLDNGFHEGNDFFQQRIRRIKRIFLGHEDFYSPQISQMDTDFFLTQILSDYTDGFPAEPLVRCSQSPIRVGSQESLAALQSV